MREPLMVNGEQWEDGGAWQPPPPPPQPKPRVFDHLDAVPNELPPIEEDRHFSRVARAMRSDEAWWFEYVPQRPKTSNAPRPVSGEMTAKTERAKRALWRIAHLSDESLAIAVEVLDDKKRAALKARLGP